MRTASLEKESREENWLRRNSTDRGTLPDCAISNNLAACLFFSIEQYVCCSFANTTSSSCSIYLLFLWCWCFSWFPRPRLMHRHFSLAFAAPQRLTTATGGQLVDVIILYLRTPVLATPVVTALFRFFCLLLVLALSFSVFIVALLFTLSSITNWWWCRPLVVHRLAGGPLVVNYLSSVRP